MKRVPAPRALLAAALLAPLLLTAASAAEEGPDFSGSVESSFRDALGVGYGGSNYAFSYGFEEYANLRLKARAGERGAVYASANLVAASGSLVPVDASTHALPPFVAGAGYAAAMELERLYFALRSEAFDAEAGLQRLAFGYGQAWSPSDFLSPRNPLLPDARPRGVLALAASTYPRDALKAKAFIVAGANPLSKDGDGALAGLSADYHARTASVQALYALEAASEGAGSALQRFGLSVKLEAGAGIVLDALYTLDGEVLSSGRYYDRPWTGLQGLQASVGADYSLLGGDLYALAQYLYNGGGALESGDGLDRLYDPGLTWSDHPPAERLPRAGLPFGELNRRNYLYAALSYKLGDFTSATASCVSGLDDLSFAPAFSFAHEPFQGLALSLTLRGGLDARTFSTGGRYGELGPTHTGTLAEIAAKAKLRF